MNSETERISIKKSTFNTLVVGAVIALAVATFVVGYLAGSSSSDINSDYITKAEMQNMIQTLEKKLDDVQVAEQPTQPVQPAAQPTQPSAPATIKVSLDDDPVKGDPDAPITIVEFSDFQCPFCERWYSNTLSAIEENYIETGKVKLVYRDMPLTRIHPYAFDAHVAAECADEQNKFWDYHDVLFDNQGEWTRVVKAELPAKLTEYATTLDLNTSEFESCISSQKIADEVEADEKQARTYGATGTPSFFIGTEEDGFIKISGAQPFSSFQNIIDEKLEQLN